jgi:type I restriction enzyme R subunit
MIRKAFVNQIGYLVNEFPDYVCRDSADEAEIGRGPLGRFQDLASQSTVILTASELLTTGVDALTCNNVAIAVEIDPGNL